MLGEAAMNKIKEAKVLVVGLGGVGGYIVEALVRAGVGTIGLCDFDVVDPTNLNRQILATTDKIGQKKVFVAKDRILLINPDCNVITYDFKLSEENIDQLDIGSWTYIADAIDDTKAKLALIKSAHDKSSGIISCMGTGNKLDPFAFEIATIEKTEEDPLARSMRKQLKEMGIKGIPVLFSREKQYVRAPGCIPSISFCPSVAGLEIASYIIKEIIK